MQVDRHRLAVDLIEQHRDCEPLPVELGRVDHGKPDAVCHFRLRDSGLVTDLRRDLSAVLDHVSALQVANSCGVHCSVLSVVVALCVPLRYLYPDVCSCGWGGSCVAHGILASLLSLDISIVR